MNMQEAKVLLHNEKMSILQVLANAQKDYPVTFACKDYVDLYDNNKIVQRLWGKAEREYDHMDYDDSYLDYLANRFPRRLYALNIYRRLDALVRCERDNAVVF